MKKRYGKYLALALAGSLLMPSAAPMAAWAADSVGSTGDSVIETDNSELPKLKRVVLPTITDDTYDFTIDVEGLLAKTSTDYDDTATVYFKKEKTPATFKFAEDTDDMSYAFQFVRKNKVEDATHAADADGTVTTGKLFDALVNEDEPILLTTLANALSAGFYVWQPDPAKVTTTGEGVFTQITKDNYTKFFTLELDTTGKNITGIKMETTPLVGATDEIWDGKIYVLEEEDVDTDDVVRSYYANGAIASNLLTDLALKVTMTPSQGDEVIEYATSVVLGKAGTSPLYASKKATVIYEEAVYEFKGETEEAKIVNKSTFDIAVTAQVSVEGNGLNFIDVKGGGTLAADTSDPTANVAIAIADTADETNNIVYTVTNTSDASIVDAANAYFVLKGTSTDPSNTTTNTYQNTTETNAATGGHNYYQYLNPGLDYTDATFKLVAEADNTGFDGTLAGDDLAAVQGAWDTYITGLEDGTYTKPEIKVVYKFEEVVELDPEGAAGEFTGAKTGAVYKAADSTGGWVAADDYTAGTPVALNFSGTGVALATAAGAVTTGDDITPGEEVTLTYTIQTEGNVVGAIKFVDTNTDPVAVQVVKNTNGTYTFEMPTVEVTMTVEEVTPGFAATSYNFTYGTDTDLQLYPAGSTLASLKFATSNTATTGTALVQGTDYTIDTATGVITLIGTSTKNLAAKAKTTTQETSYWILATVGSTLYRTEVKVQPAP